MRGRMREPGGHPALHPPSSPDAEELRLLPCRCRSVGRGPDPQGEAEFCCWWGAGRPITAEPSGPPTGNSEPLPGIRRKTGGQTWSQRLPEEAKEMPTASPTPPPPTPHPWGQPGPTTSRLQGRV